MSYSPSVARVSVDDHYFIRNYYSARTSVCMSFPENGRTKQEHKDECDVNLILNRYMVTGEIPNLRDADPRYLDCTGVDYQEAMNFVAGANTLFQELPSSLRNRFDNDAAAFLDFCSDERNREEMASLGLLRDRSEWVKVPTDFGLKVDSMASQDVNVDTPITST